MIERDIKAEFLAQLKEFPIVTVLGPRQAGKTTLVKETLPDYDYVNLEDPQVRTLVEEDPQTFLGNVGSRVILDEVQRTPHLLSYIQGIVDSQDNSGQFVLTGSHQPQLKEAISQTLAGRTGILQLLPLTIGELNRAGIRFNDFESYLMSGFLPRVHAQPQRPQTAYAAYYQTYVDRDVRQLINLKDSGLFEKFMKLLAGRVGQLLDYASLGNDVGVDGKTIRHWLSVLEASFIVFRLQPYFENFGKRMIKSPKVYFTDTGLLTYLLGIESVQQVSRDPLVGNLFENLVVLEILKSRLNQGKAPQIYFMRDSNGNELDLLFLADRSINGIEIKSSATYHTSFKKQLVRFHEQVTPLKGRFVIYNGDSQSLSDNIRLLNFVEASSVLNG